MELLTGKRALVTGAGQGIGLAIAQTLASHGAAVMLADLNTDALQLARQTIDGQTGWVPCDVSQLEQVSEAVQRTVDELGGLDILVNNAGITRDASLKNMTEQQFDDVISVHMRGTWNGLKAAFPVMRNHSGSIINISSLSGRVGLFGQTNYSAAKAGIVGMTKAAAKEFARGGCRVNAVMPGMIDTAMTQAMPPEALARLVEDIPLGRPGQPIDVANAVLFLASDLSGFITGSVLEVTGGQ